jgi:WD40 repeat protein
VFDRDAKPSLFIKTPSKVKGLAWSPDDKQLATSQGKAIVQIWNLTTCRETNSLRPLGGNHTLYSVAWNSITGELAVASANQSATVWRLPNESSPLQRMHNGRVECAE